VVYFRKYIHNFKELIDAESKEGVDCQNLSKFNSFIVSDDDYLESFCAGCFSKHHKETLPLLKSFTDNKMEILSIKVSRDQTMIACMIGKNLIKEKEELHQIVVYEINSKSDFRLIANHNLSTKFRNHSKTFEFNYRDDYGEGCPKEQSLLILSNNEIAVLDFSKPSPSKGNDHIKTVYTFKQRLKDQPDFAVFS
jgi:hypothetical protein